MAGGDLKAYVAAYESGLTPAQGRDLSRSIQSLIRRIETCGKPFAAAINGTALGGGLELALGCHYRVLLDEETVTVGLPEVRVGLLPAGGGTQRLPRIIGLERAVPLMLSGIPVSPAEALKLGIVHALAPRDRILAQAREWLLGQPDPVQPWDKKGFAVPGGAGPLAPCANQLFMTGVAQLQAENPRQSACPASDPLCGVRGHDCAFRHRPADRGQLLWPTVVRPRGPQSDAYPVFQPAPGRQTGAPAGGCCKIRGEPTGRRGCRHDGRRHQPGRRHRRHRSHLDRYDAGRGG